MFTFMSRLWNIYLMMHGMDIDFKSQVNSVSFCPSNLDLIKVRKSLLAVVQFDVKQGSKYNKISIDQSSVGYGVYLNARATHIRNAVVTPLSLISQSITSEHLERRASDLFTASVIIDEVLLVFGYTIYAGIIFLTLIPSYELWKR
mgnify:CR=1 FL=1